MMSILSRSKISVSNMTRIGISYNKNRIQMMSSVPTLSEERTQYFQNVLTRSETPKLANIEKGICLADAPDYQLEAWVSDIFGTPKAIVPVPQELFGQPLRVDLLQRVVEWERQGIRNISNVTKRRGEVRGGGKKPHQQKGTGRARQGSIRSPLNRGGGKAHGKVKRSFAHDIPKKIRRLALKVLLSMKFNEGNVLFWDSSDLDSDKAKRMRDVFEGTSTDSFVIVTPMPHDENLLKACSNFPYVHVVSPSKLFATNAIRKKTIVITLDGLEHLELWLSSDESLRKTWKDLVNATTHRTMKRQQYLEKQAKLRQRREIILNIAREQLKQQLANQNN